ncbi:elongation factor 1-gamma-like [Parambassis ranga]|uniref:Elongation factor 1-gamma-like n=1 Tax=Parambassis ranga TaxID=210632 RepID=A0A6P7J7W6_9TELE|nr:elongation factor 1-gamma-like [Parambassis ranga]
MIQKETQEEKKEHEKQGQKYEEKTRLTQEREELEEQLAQKTADIIYHQCPVLQQTILELMTKWELTEENKNLRKPAEEHNQCSSKIEVMFHQSNELAEAKVGQLEEKELEIEQTLQQKEALLTLYTYPENWRTFKAQIAAQYSGAHLKVASTSPAFTFGQTNRTPAFLNKFPLGEVPAYQGDDGFCLFESNAIAHYLSNDALRFATPQAAAQVLQWVNFADSEIIPPTSVWVFPTLGIMQFNKQATEQAKEDVKRALTVLNQHLNTRTFLVGERVSLADISVACSMLWLYKQVLEPAFRQPYPNVTRWFVTCVNQPEFKAVLGEVKLCEKMAQFDAKKFFEMQPKKDTPPKKEKAGKEAAKPQEKKEKKKEEKKPAPEEEMDDCDAVLAAEPKTKDPFAHLSKSTFVMDEFKRKYSNEDTLTVALPHFWEHFDREGYSIWYSQYKYPEELTLTFKSCNLITGMFQRLDKLRKNAFASVILFGTNNDSSISGIWIFRGQELAFTLSEDWQIDYESYDWRKLDSDSEECKTMVKEYFAWEGDFKHVGKAFNQGKVFK